MSDKNMLVAYFLANTVHQPKLSSSLLGIEIRAQLIDDIDRAIFEEMYSIVASIFKINRTTYY